jgi:branched-chain amino acid transport system substrate-binding protein
MKKTLSIVVVILLVIGIVIIISGKDEPSVRKIGFILPVTGDAAVYGQAAQNAGRLALEDLRKEGIIIDSIYEYNHLSGTAAAGILQKFIDSGDVSAVVSFGSGDVLAMCPLIEDEDIILFNSGSSPKITDCVQTFRNYPSDIYQGKVLSDKATTLGYKNIALVYLNNDYGVGLRSEFVKNYTGTIAVEEVQAPGSKDFRTQIIKIKSSGAKQIILISQLAEAIPFLNQYAEQNLEMPVLASESIKDDSLPTQISNAVINKIIAIAAAEYYGSESIKFKDGYEKKFNIKPTSFADYVYDNTMIAGKAIDHCKNIQGQKKTCMENFILNYRGIGATGNISFGTDGDVIGKTYDTFVIEDGKFVKSDR